MSVVGLGTYTYSEFDAVRRTDDIKFDGVRRTDLIGLLAIVSDNEIVCEEIRDSI